MNRPAAPHRKNSPQENLILSAFRNQVLLFIAILHILAVLIFIRNGIDFNRDEHWALQFFMLIGISLALSVSVMVKRASRITILLLGLQLFVFAVAAYPQPESMGLTILFLLIFNVMLVFWFAGHAAVRVLCSYAALFLLYLRPLPAWDQTVQYPHAIGLLITALVNALSLVSLFGFRFYIVKSANQNREIGSLKVSLGSLIDANLDFQNYAAEVGERSTLEERKRLTRDIHDGVGYTMVNLQMMLEAATDLGGGENEQLRTLLRQALNEVRNGLSETRAALRQFREIDDQKAEGIANFHKITSSFSHATGIPVEVNYGNIPWSFSEEINDAIYRILQESMTNALRHGRATKIRVNFWIANRCLRITIDDDGAGAANIKPGIGFTGMKERLAPIGGRLSLNGRSEGFTVSVDIPWPGD